MRGSRWVPPAPGEQPEVHFWQAALRARHRDAVVGAQGDLEPATKRCAVDSGNHRLGGAFHEVLDLGELATSTLANRTQKCRRRR